MIMYLNKIYSLFDNFKNDMIIQWLTKSNTVISKEWILISK